jgi:hypothetical protein
MNKWLIGLGAASVWTLLPAAPFAPPADDVVVCRRDRLPLDAETMAVLAADLVTPAKAQGGATATDRRAVAQMTALALALKPGDREAADFLSRYAKAGKPLAPWRPSCSVRCPKTLI